MGFLDKAKVKAAALVEQAKEKVDDVKDKRKVDDLLDDLGRILYLQRTGRAAAGDEAEISRLVGELQALEAEEPEIVLGKKSDGGTSATGPATTAPAAGSGPSLPPPGSSGPTLPAAPGAPVDPVDPLSFPSPS
jgi:hypothetical protein